jgi:hypothetical protein
MFLEFGRVRQPAPQESILHSVAVTPLDDVDRVVTYLRSGHGVIAMMDVQDDVFDRSAQLLNGSSILTDGDWLWRQDFAHYVGRHNVAVPAEFLRLIRERQYIVPDVDEATLERSADEAEHLMF